MTSRERMLAAMDGQRTDRVPLDIWWTPEVQAKLKAHFATTDLGEVQRRLHIDGFVGVGPRYVGPPLPVMPAGQDTNYWGMVGQLVDYGSGTYAEQIGYPLADAKTVADLDAYAWPKADWFDFSDVRRQCEERRDRAIKAGYCAPFFYLNKLRGLELSLMDLYVEPELAAIILQRVTDFFYDYHDRLFEAGGGLIDASELTDDFGMQTGLLISVEMWDTFLKPHYQRLARLMHDHGVRIFHHDDGAMWDLIPRLLDLGVSLINPIQYKCGNLDLHWLKATYGDRVTFHGGIDNQEVLPFGTVDDVKAEVRKLLAALAPGGRYILAPCHNLQPVTPVANILAMYETAWEEGWYD